MQFVTTGLYHKLFPEKTFSTRFVMKQLQSRRIINYQGKRSNGLMPAIQILNTVQSKIKGSRIKYLMIKISKFWIYNHPQIIISI